MEEYFVYSQKECSFSKKSTKSCKSLKLDDKLLINYKKKCCCCTKNCTCTINIKDFAEQLYKLVPPCNSPIILKPSKKDLQFTPSASVTYNIIETSGPEPKRGCIILSIGGDHLGNCETDPPNNNVVDICSDPDSVPNLVNCPFTWAQTKYNNTITWTPQTLNHQIITDSQFNPEGQTIAASSNLPPQPNNTNLDVKLRVEEKPVFLDLNAIQIKTSDNFDSSKFDLSNQTLNINSQTFILDTEGITSNDELTYVLPENIPGSSFDKITVKNELTIDGFLTENLLGGFALLLGPAFIV